MTLQAVGFRWWEQREGVEVYILEAIGSMSLLGVVLCWLGVNIALIIVFHERGQSVRNKSRIV